MGRKILCVGFLVGGLYVFPWDGARSDTEGNNLIFAHFL